MMHFRKKSSISNTSDHDGANRASDVKISEDDKARLKMRTASVADPILDAVQEAQPFEQAADTFHDNMNRQSYFSNEEGHVLCDVFRSIPSHRQIYRIQLGQETKDLWTL